MKCQFIPAGDSRVRCAVCARTVRTAQPPNRVHAVCPGSPLPAHPVYRDPADDVFIPPHMRPKVPGAVAKECGKCKRRKAALNAIVPGAGDLVEKFTKTTGIKRVWDSKFGDEPVTPDYSPLEAPLTASDDPGGITPESNTQAATGRSTNSKRRVFKAGEIRPRKPKGEGI